MAGTSVTGEISHLLPRDTACLDQCLALEWFYTFFSPGTHRAEYFCHRNGKVREIHFMKFAMFLQDPTPKPPPAPHKELYPVTIELISHLSHSISGASFLLIQAPPSSREEACPCTHLQSTRHANGATKITVQVSIQRMIWATKSHACKLENMMLIVAWTSFIWFILYPV